VKRAMSQLRSRRGGSLIEAALMIPILFLLLVGMTELARVGYTYFVLQKILYSLGRFVGTQQGVNFCDEADPAIVAAKNFALTGTTDASTDPLIANLTADMIQVRVEKYSSDSADLSVCACEATGCDTAQGAQGPDFVVVSLPDGYSMQLSIPFMAQLQPFLLRPHVRLPYGGT
jgi:Flp pilus assembly protein TadG